MRCAVPGSTWVRGKKSSKTTGPLMCMSSLMRPSRKVHQSIHECSRRHLELRKIPPREAPLLRRVNSPTEISATYLDVVTNSHIPDMVADLIDGERRERGGVPARRSPPGPGRDRAPHDHRRAKLFVMDPQSAEDAANQDRRFCLHRIRDSHGPRSINSFTLHCRYRVCDHARRDRRWKFDCRGSGQAA